MKPNHPNEFSARFHSFRYAIAGIRHMIRAENNAKIHLLATILVIIFASWLGVSRTEWAILILAMTIVWIGELFNTAIEAIVDMVSPEFHPLAKIAKDTAAGATLIAAIGAATVGFIIMLPPLLAKF